MENIKCQGLNCKKDGCSHCGGFGEVFVVGKCSVCGNKYLTRPGVKTLYHGKRYTSVDGLELVYRSLKEDGMAVICCKGCYPND
jgi:hypothetical protein